jgi:hypothetical protein
MWVMSPLYPTWTYFTVLYTEVQLAPMAKHYNLRGHPHEVTNSCTSLHLFCETCVHIFILIELLAFILCIRDCNEAFPNQQQCIPAMVTK